MSKLTAVSGTPTAEEELADATDTTLGHNTGDGTRGGGRMTPTGSRVTVKFRVPLEVARTESKVFHLRLQG